MAAGLDEDRVIGRLLWDFVHGGATQRLYDTLIREVRRSGRKLAFDYRGDSPCTIRYMRMSLLPGPRGVVRFLSEVLHEQSQSRAVYLAHAPHQRRSELQHCGLCNRLSHNGRWHTLDHLIKTTDLIDDLMPTEVGDTVCDPCILRIERATGVRL